MPAAKATVVASSFVLFGKWRMNLVCESRWQETHVSERQGLKSQVEAASLRALWEGFRNDIQGPWPLKRPLDICRYSQVDCPYYFYYLAKAYQNIKEILVFLKIHQWGVIIFKIMILQLEKILPFSRTGGLHCCPPLQAWVVWSRALGNCFHLRHFANVCSESIGARPLQRGQVRV